MAHESGPDNVITTPTGERIVLAPGAPRSLDGLYGLLVVAVREYRDEFRRMLEEACAARNAGGEDGPSARGSGATLLGQVLTAGSLGPGSVTVGYTGEDDD